MKNQQNISNLPLLSRTWKAFYVFNCKLKSVLYAKIIQKNKQPTLSTSPISPQKKNKQKNPTKHQTQTNKQTQNPKTAPQKTENHILVQAYTFQQ